MTNLWKNGFNLEDRIYLQYLKYLDDKDIKNLKSQFKPFGIALDEETIVNLLKPKAIKDSNIETICWKEEDNTTTFGELLETTLNLGYYLKNHEDILKEFSLNYAHNLIVRSVQEHEYDMSYNCEYIHDIATSFKDLTLPNFFNEEWKKEIDFELSRKGKLKPLIKNSKSNKIVELTIKWLKRNGIHSELINLQNKGAFIPVLAIIDIFEYCLEAYNDYEKYLRNELKNIQLNMTFNITFNEKENLIEQKCENLIDKFYFEMLTQKLQSGRILKFCDNCKKFYFGNPRQTACSARCRDILSGKYAKRKGK